MYLSPTKKKAVKAVSLYIWIVDSVQLKNGAESSCIPAPCSFENQLGFPIKRRVSWQSSSVQGFVDLLCFNYIYV